MKGHPPLLRSGCRYQHLSAISAISEAGQLYYQIQEGNFTGLSIVAFLESLLAFFDQKLLILWDGAQIHSDENVKRLLSKDDRIFLARIPAYSPELNADEQVWKALKVDRLKNVVCKNVTELKSKLQNALQDLQKQTQTIVNFFKHPKLQFYKS